MPVSPSSSNQRAQAKPLAEINVVPYIDVMLVLLVIFMVTAPMLHQGAVVDLPQAKADALPQKKQTPVIAEVDENGDYYLNIGDKPDEPISAKELVITVKAVMREREDPDILVRGHADVAYREVVGLMAQLKSAGVPSVGLMTAPPSGER
jgi:biopolymer transport protein TolR